MSLFSKKRDEEDEQDELAACIVEGRLSAAEKIRRKEFCIAQAAYLCDERPGELMRIAEQIYVWIYGEQP